MAGFTNVPGTNLGPLTTSWSMPATCSLIMPLCSTCSVGFAAQSCNAANGGSPQDNTACWPPAKAGVTSPAWPFGGWGFYSPGLACPTGHFSACTAVYGQRQDWDVQFKLFEGETAIGCCPTGYACTNYKGNTCVATITTSKPVATAYCKGTDVTDVHTAIFPDVITVTQSGATNRAMATSTATRTMELMAPMYQLNFKASDWRSSSSKSTTADSNSKTTRKSGSKTTPTPTPKFTPPKTTAGRKKKKGLSDGGKAGVGVGVAASVLGLVGSAVFYAVRKGKDDKPAGTEDPADDPKQKFLAEPPVHELPSNTVAELPAGREEEARVHSPV